MVSSTPSIPLQSATLARVGALATDFTFRRRITAQDLLGLGDEAACDALVQAVQDAHQCPLSLLLLDDLEVGRCTMTART